MPLYCYAREAPNNYSIIISCDNCSSDSIVSEAEVRIRGKFLTNLESAQLRAPFSFGMIETHAANEHTKNEKKTGKRESDDGADDSRNDRVHAAFARTSL